MEISFDYACFLSLLVLSCPSFLGVRSQGGFGRNALTEVAGARASSIAVCDEMSIESLKPKRLGKKALRPRKWYTIYLHELPLDIQFMVRSAETSVKERPRRSIYQLATFDMISCLGGLRLEGV